MFKQLINRIKTKTSPTTPVQATRRQQQESSDDQRPDIFDLPPGCTPIDTVIEGTRIPGTDIFIGKAARVVETNRSERIEFNFEQGFTAGCTHSIYEREEIGGTCPICQSELLPLKNQGLISERQFYERSQYCVCCASFCMSCFRRICAIDTRLYQCPDGKYIPLCKTCHKQLTQSLFGKLISLITGK